MRCSKCNREVDATGKCGFCGGEAEAVRVISRDEIDGYQGMTIDTIDRSDRSGEDNSYRAYQGQGASYRAGSKQKIFVKQIGFGHTSWLTKIAILVILAAVVSFIVFVALPVVLVAAGIGIVIWLVLSFLRG